MKLLISALLMLSLQSFTFANSKLQSVSVEVNGMVCDFCARSAEKVLTSQDSIDSININLNKKIIHIYFKEGMMLSEESIKDLIRQSGYDVKDISYEK